jgi:hypothetical protein
MTPEEAKKEEAIRASVRGGKGCVWTAGIIAILLLVTCLGWAWAHIWQTWNGG